MRLRPYQAKTEQDVYDAWAAGALNVMAVLPTGGGKTVLFSNIIKKHKGASVAIAHRQELVSQISLALARNGVKHRIIGPKNVIKEIVKEHMNEFGRNFYDPSSDVAVAGVDTLIRRTKQLAGWLAKVTLWVTDECHHIANGNKWMTACEMFPNAKGLGVTATPLRADGMGLGRHADGVFDVMVEGPSMRQLINAGYLTEYRITAPPADLDVSTVRVSKATGDYNTNDIIKAVSDSSLVAHPEKSKVIGDVVQHYLKFTRGLLGVTFVPNLDIGQRVADEYIAAGIPAELVSSKSSSLERSAALTRFKSRQTLQLVNVDLFGEGFDLPAIEVVSMARPTASYGLYVQQFGRVLRLLEGKQYGWLIDHVGNVDRHGLPDKPRMWSLDRREKKSTSPGDVTPTRTCLNVECLAVYERFMLSCPYCGHKPVPAERGAPAFVDGDLYELSPDVLAQMREEVEQVDMDMDQAVEQYAAELRSKNMHRTWVLGHVKKFRAKHESRQNAVATLREVMAWWAGYHRADGRTDREIFKIFFIEFGVDWMTAQTLHADKSLALADKVLINTGVIAA